MNSTAITPLDLLNAYSLGYFPMADSADSDEFYWYDPPLRGQLPIENLHIPRRLRRTALQMPYRISTNQAFTAVIDLCAAPTPTRPGTWINRKIRNLFIELHHAGYAHSLECWHGHKLAGGLYGLALGGAFCGESMFSRARDASKIALIHLCARLWQGGFTLLDTQFTNPHLEQFGIYEIPAATYKEKLFAALPLPARFPLIPDQQAEKDLLHAYLDQNKGL